MLEIISITIVTVAGITAMSVIACYSIKIMFNIANNSENKRKQL